jgi:surface carbohydrate biosynthesis protein
MGHRKRILCLVDYKYRDLAGLSLLKVLLESRGLYEVILVPHNPRYVPHIYLREFRPAMVILSYVTKPAHAEVARQLQGAGVGVVLLPTEGMGYNEIAQLQAAGKGYDFGSLDLVVRWNETVAALSDRESIVPRERSIVTGVPRFDFYRPPLNALLASKQEFCAEYGLDSARPMVSWSTNFSFTVFADKPGAVDRAIAGLKDGQSQHWRDFAQRVATEVDSRDQLSAAVFRIARAFPAINVVIKIHPGEERGWYDERIGDLGLRNVRVIHREYIWNVLNPTDLHLHTSCTTGFEAWLLDKPTIDLQFPRRDWFHAPQMFAGGHVAESSDECLDQVRHYLQGGTTPAEFVAARSGIVNWFAGPVDGRSAQRCANAIHGWFLQSDRVPTTPRFTIEDLRYGTLKRVRSAIGLQPHQSVAKWLRREPQDPLGRSFTVHDVDYWVTRIRQVLVPHEDDMIPGAVRRPMLAGEPH